MPLYIIVACEQNNGIGLDNKIPWYVPEDLKYFKQTTLHNTVIMGRNTFLSLNNKPLSNRKNIVVTSKKCYSTEGNLTFMNIKESKNYIENNTNENIFIIGGESIYNEFLNECHYIYITKIYDSYKCDRYFNYNLNNYKEEFSSEVMYSTNENIKYQFIKLKRII